MREYIEKACEEIDAAMFSGDAFMEKDERDELTNYIGRWQRKMKEWEEIAAEIAEETKTADNS
jgi:ADP-dependent phosphofructokinase/glucokinase